MASVDTITLYRPIGRSYIANATRGEIHHEPKARSDTSPIP